jgi:hypothetical protein
MPFEIASSVKKKRVNRSESDEQWEGGYLTFHTDAESIGHVSTL